MKPSFVLVLLFLLLIPSYAGWGQASFVREWWHGGVYRQIDLPIGPPAGALSGGIVSGDFNEDGNVDLVIVTAEVEPITGIAKNSMILLLGDGAADFPSTTVIASRRWEIAIAGGSEGLGGLKGFDRFGGFGPLLVGDFDNDGRLDLAAIWQITEDSGTFDSHLILLWGDGTGEFTEEEFEIELGFSFYSNLISQDFNHDGRLDIAFPDFQNLAIDVMWGDEERNFTRQSTFPLEENYVPISIASGDFDADGRLDLAVAGFLLTGETEARRFVRTLRGDGAGGFVETAAQIVGAVNRRVLYWIDIKAGDYTGDGQLDLITIRRSERENEGAANRPALPVDEEAVVLFGKGDGTFTDPKILFGVLESSGTQLVLISSFSEGTGVFEITAVAVVRSQGVQIEYYGWWAQPSVITGFTLPVGDVKSGVVADIDNDGSLEIIVVCYSSFEEQTRLVILKKAAEE